MKEYEVIKYVKADSLEDAIKAEKKTAPHTVQVFSDEEEVDKVFGFRNDRG